MNRRRFLIDSLAALGYLAFPDSVRPQDKLILEVKEFREACEKDSSLAICRQDEGIRQPYLDARGAELGIDRIIYDPDFTQFSDRMVEIRELYDEKVDSDAIFKRYVPLSKDTSSMVVFDKRIFGVGHEECIYFGPAVFTRGYRITHAGRVPVDVVDPDDRSQVYRFREDADVDYQLRIDDLMRKRVAHGYKALGFAGIIDAQEPDLVALIMLMSLEAHSIYLPKLSKSISHEYLMSICRECKDCMGVLESAKPSHKGIKDLISKEWPVMADRFGSLKP